MFTSRSLHSILTIFSICSFESSSGVGGPVRDTIKCSWPTGPLTEYLGSIAGRNGLRISGPSDLLTGGQSQSPSFAGFVASVANR